LSAGSIRSRGRSFPATSPQCSYTSSSTLLPASDNKIGREGVSLCILFHNRQAESASGHCSSLSVSLSGLARAFCGSYNPNTSSSPARSTTVTKIESAASMASLTPSLLVALLQSSSARERALSTTLPAKASQVLRKSSAFAGLSSCPIRKRTGPGGIAKSSRTSSNVSLNDRPGWSVSKGRGRSTSGLGDATLPLAQSQT
jgi:hypothetical protein